MSPVALDATLYDEPITGIGLYLRQLAKGLERSGADFELWGASSSGLLPRGKRSKTAWTLGPLRAELLERRPRLYHALANFNLPLQRVPGVPFVLTVHDLVPMLLPDTVSTAFRWQFRLWLSRSLRVAEQIICVSDTTRRSVLEHFEVDPAKLHVVHHGVDHVQAVPAADATTLKWIDALGLPEPWILYAGALDARKNVELVLAAVESLHDQGQRPTLVLAGQRWFGAGPIEARVKALKAMGVDVRALGYLDDRVFYAVMQRAGVFVFPSRYEGFGLPPLEAMQLGVPTIISTEGSLPEVCGDGAEQVAPDDVLGLAARLSALLTDAAAREALSARGRAQAAKYRWVDAARKTADIYRQASGERA